MSVFALSGLLLAKTSYFIYTTPKTLTALSVGNLEFILTQYSVSSHSTSLAKVIYSFRPRCRMDVEVANRLIELTSFQGLKFPNPAAHKFTG